MGVKPSSSQATEWRSPTESFLDTSRDLRMRMRKESRIYYRVLKLNLGDKIPLKNIKKERLKCRVFGVDSA